jgi:PKD repeat protein
VIVAAGNLPPVADADGPYSGVVGADVVFDGTGSSDPDGSISQYDWRFGDGSAPEINAGPTPSHSYAAAGSYHVILEVHDNLGVRTSDRTEVTIGTLSLPPMADADGPYRGTVDAAVSFDGSGSTDPDGTIMFYDWDYGDGTPLDIDAGPNPIHVYTASGSYTVILTVTDDTGESDSANSMATIGTGNLPPSADADGPYAGVVDVPVSFDGTGSEDLDGTIVSYEWDFGDGTTPATEESPDHPYDAAGPYFVTLTVTDDLGAIGSDGTLVMIPEPSPGLSMLAALVTLSLVARSRGSRCG